MTVHEIKHPLVQHKMGLLREKNISIKSFRELTSEIATLLTYEATKNLNLESKTIETWCGPTKVQQIAGKKVSIVPVLRAGMGMLDGVLQIIPGARVSVVGMFRDEKTLKPTPYYENLVSDIQNRHALVIDPMLATGGTLLATLELLKSAGCKQISGVFLVAAPEGIAAIQAQYPEVDLYVAAVDRELNTNGFILPGLGDAGDKIFGTR